MSAEAVPIYNALVERGVPPERAEEAAEAAVEAQRKALEEARRQAEEFTERKAAETEKALRGEMAVAAERAAAQAERAAAQTERVRRDAAAQAEQVRRDAAVQTEQVRRESVTRDEFHRRTAELATRAELHAVRDEMCAEFAASRAEHRADMRAINDRLDRLNSRFDQLHRLIIALLLIFGGGMATLVGLAARFVFAL